MKVARKLAVAVGAVAMMVASAARAQVLKQVPSDALVVFKITNLEAANKKVAAFNQSVGLAQLKPEAGDPLAALEKQSGMSQGIDAKGDAVIAFLNPDTAGGPGNADKSMLILVPVTDYKAFLGNFPDAKTEGDISTFKFKDDNDDTYAAQWGSYAALSPTKDVVTKKPDGLALTGLAAKEMDGKDFAFLANLKVLRTKLLPQLQDVRTKFEDQLDKNLKNDPKLAKFGPVLKVSLDQLLNIGKEFLTDANAATLSVNFGQDGIGTTLMAEFEESTYLGQRVKEVKNTDQSLLAGLPDSKYVVFGGSTSDPQLAGKIVADIVDPIAKELATGGPDNKPFTDYIDAVKQAVGAQTGGAVGVLAPTGALGQDALLQLVSIQNGDPKVLIDAQKKMFDGQQEIMKAFGGPAATQAKTEYKENAKTVDGVSFNQLSTTFNLNPQTPQEMQAAQMLQFMYGANGMQMLTGAVTDKSVLTTSGLPDATLSAAIAAAKAGDDPLAKLATVKTVAAQLPQQRVAAFYFPLDQLVTTGVTYAKQFGLATGIQLPADLPPIGATVGTEGEAIRIDSYYPSQLIQALVSAGMQAYMQVNQGQNGAGGAGGGGGGGAGGPNGL